MSPSGDLDRDELDTDDTANMALAFTGDQIDQEDRSSPHLSTADIETKSPSGDLDLQLDPDDTASIVLPLAAICGENESEVRPDSSCANLELMSSSGRSVLTTELQPSDMDQQFTCDSSSKDSVSGDDSEIPDIPEDDPFRQIGFDTDMDSVLMSAEVLPRSKYLFSKVFKNNSEIVEFHFYCKTCKVYIGKQEDIQDKNITQCAICSAPIEISSLNSASFFLNIPIAPQIQTLLENPQIQNSMSYRHQKATE
ncbi:hypothetical protein ROHU_017568 [Labeo rohita]|uniref:Uncharacterized protein n=1 Tax=Labeo rohita TaxID=84645 RepID=A0A498NFR1_LABRO|nr:hypothetical protein ROHU_017568 [Labeo rohita]